MSDNVGMKISMEGKDVSPSQDERNLILTSKYPTLRVFREITGSLQLTTDGFAAEGSTKVTHNLGYKPAFMWYLTDATPKQFQMPYNRTSEAVYWGYSTTTDVRIGGFIFSASNQTFPFKVIIFVNELRV